MADGAPLEPEQSVPDRRREAKRRRREAQRERKRVPLEELPLFISDPLREDKLGWTDVRVCRLCRLKAEHLPNHLLMKHREELSVGRTIVSSKALLEEYRRCFGYNKNAPLISEDLRKANSKALRTRNARRKHQGRPVFGQKARFRKRHSPTQGATAARKQYGMSAQARQRMSIHRRRRALPAHRKKNAEGQTVTDWQIAKPRLDGKECSDIAKKLDPPLTRLAVRARLVKIGFPPGKPSRFFRGEPVTEKLLRSHYEDLKFIDMSRALLFRAGSHGNGQHTQLTVSQVAQFLETPKSWIYEHTRERSKDQIPHSSSAGILAFDFDQVLHWALSWRNGKTSFLGVLEIETKLADRLGVGVRRVHEFVIHPKGPVNPRNREIHRKPGHPLSWDLAGALLSSITSLRQEYRKLGSTARGGRPGVHPWTETGS